ncbi:MAG TPA: hypothetical protein VFE78_38965 [Gemmataceae bacterium]|jgi:hypothetical protein|nr:hypothetical protein [Gemmataceae bacterium]
MDPDDMQAVAERDQLWASLRALQPEIELVATGSWANTERERQVMQLLARIVLAELSFRAKPRGDPGE